MYKPDLASNNLQRLICHKTKLIFSYNIFVQLEFIIFISVFYIFNPLYFFITWFFIAPYITRKCFQFFNREEGSHDVRIKAVVIGLLHKRMHIILIYNPLLTIFSCALLCNGCCEDRGNSELGLSRFWWIPKGIKVFLPANDSSIPT